MASGNPENPRFGQVTDHPSRLGSGRMTRQSLPLGETRRLVPVSAYTGDPIRRYGFRKSGPRRSRGFQELSSMANSKRRKLDDIRNEELTTFSTTSECSSITARLNSTEAKTKLSNKTSVISFVDKRRPCLYALISVFQKYAAEVLHTSDALVRQEMILKESISIIANICHFSLTACVELKNWSANLSQIYLRILESGEQTDTTNIKANILRLLGNLCMWKQTTTVVTSNAALLDRVSMSIIHEDALMADRALRIVRFLTNQGLTKVGS
ncbi:hypothetical protein DdX_01098 [Ditylenchus destructor]|uniref:Uncharacterized protein n=1 Tax=Ditylenchus destructor TaxID=166010 RepID=A0AAD4NL70_9BILA|nr:hypothetical protein DdX_01098 [Ditylenchus destructor]